MELYKVDGLILQINLKSLCNLDCDYCLLPKHVKSQKESDNVIIDNAIKLVEKIKADNLDIRAFTVFGAEPFTVNPFVMSTVFNIIGDNFPTTFLKVQTNGTLSNPKYMMEFINNLKYQHMLMIGFSLDGVKEIHDKHRCDSWDLAIDNFFWIKHNSFIKTNVICTTNIEHFDNGKNEAELLDFILTMRDRFDTEVNISFADLTIRGVGETHIGETEYSKKFADFLINNDLIDNCIKLFRPNYCYRKGNDCHKTLFDLNQFKTYQCEKEFNPDKEFTNWEDKTIPEVMELRKARTENYPIADECGSCEYWEWCKGGCPLKRDNEGLAKACYVTKRVLDHIKHNVDSDWYNYLLTRGGRIGK